MLGNDNETPVSYISPSGLGKRSGVRRVNNLPLYFIGGVLVVFLLLIALVAVDRAHKAQASGQNLPEKQGDSTQLANSIIGNQTNGMIVAAETVTPPNLSVSVPIPTVDDLDKPTLPARLKDVVIADPDIERITQKKIQLFEQAVTGKTSVELAELKAHTDDISGDKGEQPSKISADGKNINDRWQLGSQVEAPKSAYILRAGFIIPATLISGINSDLPGQIMGQISQNVYDTATGKYLLLPQGSRLVGSYASDMAYGQSRVMVVWQRIIFPDGKTLDIGAMPGADSAGYAGFNDQLDNHYLRVFGSAILMSGITAGVSIAQSNSSNSSLSAQPTVSSTLSEALGQQLGNVSAQIISKNLNTSPTIKIRAGFRFNVMCLKDLVLTKPYTSFDY